MPPRSYPAPSLIVLIGPPGAGKTTWLDENLPDATRVDLEEIRRNPDANRDEIITDAINKAFAELRDNNVVVFDSTAIRSQMRSRLRGIARSVGAPVYAVIFNVPLDDLLAAQTSRKYPVPDDRVRELHDQFQNQLAAIYAEGWDGTDTVTRPTERSMRAVVSLVPTASIAAAARKGLRLHEEGKSGDGLVAATVRDARRMANREPLSEAKVRRMPGWFARHETDKTADWDQAGEETPGYVAWLLWGGDSARTWAERKVKQLDNAQADRSRRDILPGSMDAAEELETVSETEEAAVPLTSQLATLLADVLTMYLHAHGAHWNVKGGSYGTFAQWHSLFGDIYEDVHGSADPLAENLLKLGVDAPYRMTEILALREVQDPVEIGDDPRDLALMLLADNAKVLDCLDDAFQRATADNEQGVANFLADRIDQHQKWAWQLRASLDIKGEGDVEEEPAIAGRSAERSSEERSVSPVRVEYRESGAGANYRTITGYASVANRMSEDLGGFREIIAPGAFRDVLAAGAPVKLLYDHDSAAVLASTSNGTLELREDETGLHVWARVDMSDPDVQRVAAKLRSGIVDQMSFAFTVADDEWDYTGGVPVRTVRSVDSLFEVSVVAFPAYNQTKVTMLERARNAGRLPLGGASDTAPIPAGGESHDTVVDPVIRAAYWRAQLNLSKQKAS